MIRRLALIATAVLSAITVVGGASAAAAVKAGKPDLAMRSVSTQQGATPGASIGVELSVARSGRVGAARVGIYLLRDRVRDRTDQRLAGGGRVPGGGARLGPATVRIAAQASIPSGQPLGTYVVIACVDDPNLIRERDERNNCGASASPLTVAATAVSTTQLLAAAVAAHKLSPQRALVYRVFAAFGDPRLPSVYAGENTQPDDLVMRAVLDAWSTLSAAQQAELRPFFTPPAASGSGFSPTGSAARASAAAGAGPFSCRISRPARGWHSLANPGGHVKLWWSNSDNARIGPRMRPLLSEVETTIWPRLHQLMGREPLPDDHVFCFNGGDGKLDIYMVGRKFNTYTQDHGALAATISYPGRCSPAPTLIVVDVRHGAPARSTLAHELMHAFQDAFRYHDACDSYSAWDESTATWAEQYIYPHDDAEHKYTPWYPESALPKTAYEGWLFPYAMEQLHGAQTIAAIYQQAERLPVAQAIDAGVPGGLEQAWPEFALKAWNDDSVAPSFKQWDNFAQQPLEAYIHGPVPTETLDVTPDSQPQLAAPPLIPLTRDYYHFTVAPNVTWVSISQQPAPGIHVDAIERFGDGTTQIEQLPGSRTFCSTDPAKRLADLVLVISNSSLTRSPTAALPDPLKLSAGNDICGPIHYRVLSASVNLHVVASAPASAPGRSCPGSASWTIAGTSTGPASDENNAYLAPGGPDLLTGELNGRAESTYTYQVSSCKFVGNVLVPCSYAGSDPIGPHSIGLSIVAHPSSGQATLDWALTAPGSGAPSDPCKLDAHGELPPDTFTQTVPLAKLLSPDPQTFTLAGSAHVDHVIEAGASLDDDWNLSLTVQRQ